MNLTEKEIEQLNELKKDFEASIHTIEDILKGLDVEENLDYIVRDWCHTDPMKRNDAIMHRARILKNALERIEAESN